MQLTLAFELFVKFRKAPPQLGDGPGSELSQEAPDSKYLKIECVCLCMCVCLGENTRDRVVVFKRRRNVTCNIFFL